MGNEIVNQVWNASFAYVAAAVKEQAPEILRTIAKSPLLVGLTIGGGYALAAYAMHQGYGYSRNDPDGTVHRFGPQCENGIRRALATTTCA